ncbi:hypothetical protein D3C81_1627240 [compost metagenome]
MDWLAHFKASALRGLQETHFSLQHVLNRGIEATRDQVSINLILVGVGLGFYPGLVQHGLGVGLLGGALFIANGFASQRRDVFAQARAFLKDEGCWHREQFVGEIDDFFPRRSHGHGRNHAVEFIGPEAGNHPVEITFYPFALDLQFSANRVTQINIKANKATVGGLGFEGRIRGVDTKTQLLVLLGHGRASSHA